MAYLKIADGCGHRCRFCVIPSLRGPYRSRRLESVVREAEAMAREGVREINLVAQDTTAYGRDTKEAELADLLERLAQIEELHWIRLLYAYPTSVTPRLIETMAKHEKMCNYLDIPLQHADREILRSMGRPGDGESYLKLIADLRAAMPGHRPPLRLHRRLSRRGRGGVPSAAGFPEGRATGSRGRVHLLPRARARPRRSWNRRCRPRWPSSAAMK